MDNDKERDEDETTGEFEKDPSTPQPLDDGIPVGGPPIPPPPPEVPGGS